MSLPDPIELAKALNSPKSLRQFTHRFGTETDCEEFLFRVRYPKDSSVRAAPFNVAGR
jgi:hypothetical protein